MRVDVVELSPEVELDYARFVAEHPHALITYTLPYRDLLTELLGAQARYGVARRDGMVVGVMPLMSLAGTYGTVLNSLPYFGSSGGPLAADASVANALRAWYSAEARRDGVVAATVIANPLAGSDSQVDHDLMDLRIGHITQLAGDGDPYERVWGTIDGSARRNVKKAQRSGTAVGVENESFAELISLHQRAMGEIGAPAKTASFFAGVRRHFRPGADFDVYVARIGGDPAAALLVFYCAGTVDYYVPAVSPERRGEQPMAAILVQAMVDAARRGLVRWNWGGSWPSHESLRRFKAKWGGIPREYVYETKLNDRGLLRARREDLLAAYPGFFVVPFAALET